MPIAFKDYKDAQIDVEKHTAGGDTYIMNGVPLCYTYTSKHFAAVKALTQQRSTDIKDIKQEDVEKYIESGILDVDTTGTVEGFGWLGAKVWDGRSGIFIGEVGARCGSNAGHGTQHPGHGRCRSHHGDRSITSIATNYRKNGVALREGIINKIEAYALDPRVLDLVSEVSRQKVLLDDIQGRVFDMIDDDEQNVSDREVIDLMTHIVRLSDTIGKQIERVTMIDQRNALTANQVLYLQIVVKDILTTYVEDPKKLQKAVTVLAERLGTSEFSPKLLEAEAPSTRKKSR